MTEPKRIRIELQSEPGVALAAGKTAILVPDRAIDEPGHIRTLPAAPNSTAKHDLHQLSQMALFDFEDAELTPRTVPDGVVLVARMDDEVMQLEDGLIVLREEDGTPLVIAREGAAIRALLSHAHRFCTRWIRLDVC